MKILHIIFSLNTGGAETMLVDLVNEQVKTETVELLIVNDSISENLTSCIHRDVKTHYLKRVPGSINPLKVFQLNYLIYKIKPTVIHFHNHNASRFVKYKAKAKTFLTVHTINVPVDNYRQYTRVFSISNSVKRDIFDRCSTMSTRIYNGVDFTQIKTKCDYSLKSCLKIVQVSRLCHEIKGQHILLKALHHLVHSSNITSITLDFIGDGPSLRYLKKLTGEYELTNHVNFLGCQERSIIYENLRTYDLLIQPSIVEGFGLTVIEGIAAGLPIIVSNADGPAEIVRSIPCGWIFQSNQVNSLTRAITEVIDLYRSNKTQALCEMNLLTAAQRFSVQKTAQNYIRNYI